MLVRLGLCVAVIAMSFVPSPSRAADCSEEVSKLMSKDTEKLNTRFNTVSRKLQDLVRKHAPAPAPSHGGFSGGGRDRDRDRGPRGDRGDRGDRGPRKDRGDRGGKPGRKPGTPTTV